MLINEAYAQTNPSGGLGFDPQIIILVGMFVVLYFFLMRPQMKRAKEQKQMIASLTKGDEVITGGGLLGRVTKVSDSYVSVEIAPNVEITVQKSSVQTLLPKGTLKNAS